MQRKIKKRTRRKEKEEGGRSGKEKKEWRKERKEEGRGREGRDKEARWRHGRISGALRQTNKANHNTYTLYKPIFFFFFTFLFHVYGYFAYVP